MGDPGLRIESLSLRERVTGYAVKRKDEVSVLEDPSTSRSKPLKEAALLRPDQNPDAPERVGRRKVKRPEKQKGEIFNERETSGGARRKGEKGTRTRSKHRKCKKKEEGTTHKKNKRKKTKKNSVQNQKELVKELLFFSGKEHFLTKWKDQ